MWGSCPVGGGRGRGGVGEGWGSLYGSLIGGWRSGGRGRESWGNLTIGGRGGVSRRIGRGCGKEATL